MQNRRQFTRILFSIPAELAIEQQVFNVNIHDISLKGVLIFADTKGLFLEKKLGLLSLKLDDFGAKIIMEVTVAHQESNKIGLQCNGIDIDSVSLLRRLIELNLADDKQFHKELSQLTRP
ncbi:PilZ domain-containing protein [Colwellia sp. MB02u-9]|uniref:PilZ domain-containing protein n=1 Tax=Colwellia sp. MB02u-9 TaxID=2759823 RepID=UPI0015F50239|nr:PilZ domain-containing protein [Colwellia sp. MB02u-9]MBA6297326.1 PilZ domain-containing protein [Colwellia sp. MB02u-9]